MRALFFAVLLLSAAALHAQVRFETHETSCPIDAERVSKVDHFLQLAIKDSDSMEKGEGHEFTYTHTLGAIANIEACIGHYEQAARQADAAYPAGSEALSALGKVLVKQNQLSQASSLGKLMTHGSHSFYFGVVEELSAEAKFSEARAFLSQIDSPEVRADAAEMLTSAMLKAGRTDEANALQKQTYDALPAEQKKEVSARDAELETLIAAGQWTQARAIITQLPARAQNYLAITIAADEADAHETAAHADLLAVAATYVEHRDGPPAGYLISSRLASLHDYTAAEKVAAAIHDDEWNQRAWATIATFRAEDGDFAQARAAIAKIGRGAQLEHDLQMGPMGRDVARERVAAVLISQGHADVALTFLAEQEDKEGIDNLLPIRVQALVTVGQIKEAQTLVLPILKQHATFISEEDQALAVALVVPWHDKDPTAVEQWIAAQPSAEVRTTAWLALVNQTSGDKPPVYHYFVNWD